MIDAQAPARARRRVSTAVAAAAFMALLSCAANESSATLALSLKPGMEKRMRFTTEQVVNDPQTRQETSTKVSLTYLFRVASVNASGLSRVDMEVQAVEVSGLPASGRDSLEAVRARHLVATLDRSGTVLDMRMEGSSSPLPGLPGAPGSGQAGPQGTGDLGSLFGGLTGKNVSVGETWTTALPSSLSGGLRGTVRWTLTSVRGKVLKLSSAGTLERQEISVPGAAGEMRATVSGDATSTLELDRDSGWPRHGQSVVRLTLAGAPSDSSSAPPPSFAMRVVTRFDELP